MIRRCWIVAKKDYRGMVMNVFAVFMDRDAAAAFASDANAWYGEDHPLTPLVVLPNESLFEPRLFPVAELRKAFPND